MRKVEPNAYGSSWYSATRVASPPRDPLHTELDVDVCVIGAGLAGLTVAREVARRGWSVAVLEAQSVAWNASGRNTGFVLPGYAASAGALVSRVGLEHAKKLWALSVAGADYVRATAEDPAMQGIAMSEGGWLHVSKTDDDLANQAETELLAEKFGAAVEYWPAERVRDAARSPLYFSGLHYPRGFSLHPLNYALGLAAMAEAAGARIYEGTEALGIDPAGVRKRIDTRHARVRAGHVVLAGSAHLSGLMPQFSSTLLPVFSYVIVTAPLGEGLRDVIRFPGAVSDTGMADNHYRVVEDNRLMWSGRSTVWRGKPQRYVDTLLHQIAQAYPQLRNVKAEYAWTGMLANTVHRMPQIGEITPGLWLLSGFGGHGLNTTAMGGDIVARAIVEGDHTSQLFSPFALVWAGGVFGRAAHQAYYWSQRTRERIGGGLARKREALRQRAAQALTGARPPEAEAAPPQALAVEPEAAAPPETPPVAAEPPPAPKKRRKRKRTKKAVAAAPEVPAETPPSGETA